jgi:hypothetical protein
VPPTVIGRFVDAFEGDDAYVKTRGEFITPGGMRWIIRQHGRRLVECGALIHWRNRVKVDPEMLDRELVEIGREQARRRLGNR